MNVMAIRHVKDDCFDVEGRVIYANSVDVFVINNEYMATITLEVLRRYYKLLDDQPSRDVIGAKIGRLRRLIDSRWPDKHLINPRHLERVRAREEQWISMIRRMCGLILDERLSGDELKTLARRHLAKTKEART